MRNRIILVFSILVIGLGITTFVFAENVNSPANSQGIMQKLQETIQQLQEKIKALEVQVAELKAQLETTKAEVVEVKEELKFSRALKLGEKSEEVRELQEVLKLDPKIYPEGLVTGYFGPLTQQAVKRFQERYADEILAPIALSEGTGFVGEKTISKLNEIAKAIPAVPAQVAVPGERPAIPASPAVPPEKVKAEPEKSTPPQETPSGTQPAIPATPAQPAIPTQEPATPAIPAIPAIPIQPSPPPPQATVDIKANSSDGPITLAYNTAAAITWTSTNTTSCVVSPNGWAGLSGSQSTGNLTSSTTYQVNCTSSQGSVFDSVQVNVSAPPQPQDTTSPVISNISATNISSTAATITWTTDESSDTQVEYGTSVFYGISSSLDANLTTSHSVSLSNLQPTTLYHFRVKSKDTAGNFVVSTEQIFTTLAASVATPPSTQTTGPGTIKWTFDINGLGAPPALAHDGTVYVSKNYFGGGKLYAVNPDGTQKWVSTVGDYDYLRTPAIAADGTIFVGSSERKLYAITPSGVKKWAFEVVEAIRAGPAIASDGTIFITAGSNRSAGNKLYAINPNGSEKWSFDIGTYCCPSNSYFDLSSSPAIARDGTIYFGAWLDSKLYAVNPDGTLKWAFATGASIYGSPALGSDGTIYIGSDDNNLYAINPDGTLKWSFATGTPVRSPVIGPDGTIYFGALYKLYAVNPNGAIKWSYSVPGALLHDPHLAPTIGADGTIYITTYESTVVGPPTPPLIIALNQDGTLKWSSNNSGHFVTSPAIGSDGTLYTTARDIADGNFKLYAINSNSSGGLANSPWPKFRKNNRNTGNHADTTTSLIPENELKGLASVLSAISDLLSKIKELLVRQNRF